MAWLVITDLKAKNVLHTSRISSFKFIFIHYCLFRKNQMLRYTLYIDYGLIDKIKMIKFKLRNKKIRKKGESNFLKIMFHLYGNNF